jgi:predicted membrane protein
MKSSFDIVFLVFTLCAVAFAVIMSVIGMKFWLRLVKALEKIAENLEELAAKFQAK